MSRRLRGFTLIEMLLVISMSLLVMLAMGSALRTMAQSEERVGQRLQRNDQMRVTQQFLQQILGHADAAKVPDPQTPATQRIRFSAVPNAVQWIGLMPARHGAAGRFFFRLALEDGSNGTDLALRYAPADFQASFPDWQQSEKHILVRDVTDFSVEAKGVPLEQGAPPTVDAGNWSSEWKSAADIPQQLRLRWSDKWGAWPPLVMSMAPTLQSQANQGGFVVGGSRK